MKEDFVTYDLAVKLKEKGFREHVRGHYKSKCHLSVCSEPMNCNGSVSGDISAPQIHEVLKWLREEKKIYCLPYFEQGIDMWLYAICRPSCGCEYPEVISESIYDTYEQASIEGITWVLDNLI